MNKIVRTIDGFVFAVTTFAIAGVFYEGIKLQWFPIVGVLILCMDYSFLCATILHLTKDRKSKWVGFHVISLIALIVAIAMKMMNIQYPTITLVIWYFYIWFLYGIINIKAFYTKEK